MKWAFFSPFHQNAVELPGETVLQAAVNPTIPELRPENAMGGGGNSHSILFCSPSTETFSSLLADISVSADDNHQHILRKKSQKDHTPTQVTRLTKCSRYLRSRVLVEGNLIGHPQEHEGLCFGTLFFSLVQEGRYELKYGCIPRKPAGRKPGALSATLKSSKGWDH